MRERREGLVDFLLGEFGRAVADARGKLLDEGWFGRRAHEPAAGADLGWTRSQSPDPMPGLGQHTPTFEEQWAVRPPGDGRAPNHDRGIDLDR